MLRQSYIKKKNLSIYSNINYEIPIAFAGHCLCVSLVFRTFQNKYVLIMYGNISSNNYKLIWMHIIAVVQSFLKNT